MKPRACHTSVNKGKRVLVRLRDGDMVVDKFKASLSKSVTFEENGRIQKSNIRSMTIIKKGSEKL